jgi:catechol-2,3-dioxygenase
MSEPKVCDVRYVGLAVASLESERAFFIERWGLRETAASAGLAYLATHGDSQHHVIRLRESETPRLDVVGLAASDREAVDALFDRLISKDVRVIDSPHPLGAAGGGYGFRCFDLDGRTLEISCDVESVLAREIARGESIPVRLSHVVLHSPDVAAAADFYASNLGFKVSDWLGSFMCFLRCNSAHHRLAFLPGPPALNHIAFDMRSVDEMMAGISRLARSDVKTNWGPGRHTAGNNTFAYFATPSGIGVEYTAELEMVDDATWQPTVYNMAPEITDRWGTGRLFIESQPHKPPPPDRGLWIAPPV